MKILAVAGGVVIGLTVYSAWVQYSRGHWPLAVLLLCAVAMYLELARRNRREWWP